MSIQAEAALDGVYALRTSLEDAPDSTDVVAHYKRLSKVETAFRAPKSVSLRVRPIHHRKASRVTGHVFLCMLAYYVEYHLRTRLAPLLFAEDDLDGKAAQRTRVVAPARRSAQTEQKARTQRTATGDHAMSYASLMKQLSGLCRSIAVPKITMDKAHQVTMRAPLTATQKRAFELLNIRVR